MVDAGGVGRKIARASRPPEAGVRQSPIGLKGIPHPPPCGPPSPLGEGGGFSFYPSPLGRGGTARRWVRGLFASNAFMAPEVCDTRDFDGTLRRGVMGQFDPSHQSLRRKCNNNWFIGSSMDRPIGPSETNPVISRWIDEPMS